MPRSGITIARLCAIVAPLRGFSWFPPAAGGCVHVPPAIRSRGDDLYKTHEAQFSAPGWPKARPAWRRRPVPYAPPARTRRARRYRCRAGNRRAVRNRTARACGYGAAGKSRRFSRLARAVSAPLMVLPAFWPPLHYRPAPRLDSQRGGDRRAIEPPPTPQNPLIPYPLTPPAAGRRRQPFQLGLRDRADRRLAPAGRLFQEHQRAVVEQAGDIEPRPGQPLRVA